MAATLTQVVTSLGNASSTTTVAATIAASASGALLVAVVMARDSSTVTGVADNAGNTYTRPTNGRATCGSNFANCVELWYKENATPGATVVTATYNGAARDRSLFVFEWAGCQTSGALDVAAAMSDGLSVDPTGPSVTSTTAGAVVAALTSENTITGIVAGSGFTSDGIDNAVSGFITSAAAHKISGAPGTHTPQWNEGNTHFGAVTVAFKEAGASDPQTLTASPAIATFVAVAGLFFAGTVQLTASPAIATWTAPASTLTQAGTVQLTASPAIATWTAPASTVIVTQGLVYAAHLHYVGACRVPRTYVDAPPHVAHDNNSLTGLGAGRGLSFDPAGNGGSGSLFMHCHFEGLKFLELAIPSFVVPAHEDDFASLNTTPILQYAWEPTGGAVFTNPKYGDTNGGILVSGDTILHSNYVGYDGTPYQQFSHWKRTSRTLTAGNSTGPYQVGSDSPLLTGVNRNTGLYSGYMGHIPAAWQARLGGDIIVGGANFSILPRTSFGPCAFATYLANIGVNNNNPSPLVYYSTNYLDAYNQPPGPHVDNCPVADRKTNLYWTRSDRITSVVMIPGTDTIMIFGRRGVGGHAYGQGTDIPALDGTPYNEAGDVYVLDPAHPTDKGSHSYPYVTCAWCYRASDAQLVKEGSMNAYDALPYTIIEFRLPFETHNLQRDIAGATWDSLHNQLLVTQAGVDYDGNLAATPIIHAFTLDMLTLALGGGPAVSSWVSSPSTLTAVAPAPTGGYAPFVGDVGLVARRWLEVTPSDTDDLPALTEAIYVGGAGDVAILGETGVVRILKNVPAGVTLPFGARRIRATGTSATNIMALWE